MSTDTNTRLYLLYNDENISEYLTDPRVYPLQLTPQTIFFESDAFRKISIHTIPDSIEYIGFITPSFLRKSRGKILASFCHTGEKDTVIGVDIPLFQCNYVDTAQYFHPNFRVLWEWLIHNMGFLAYNYSYKNIHLCANMWLTKKDIAIKAIEFICKGIQLLETAPNNVQQILYSDTKYGGKLTSQQLLEKFGVSHYPYHPFLIERLIIFFCDVHNLSIKPIV
jgi:hypothetical protein